MIALLLLVPGAVVGLAVFKRRHDRELSGLNASRPQFSVAPPARRLGGIKNERL